MLLCHAKAAIIVCIVQKMPCILRICYNSFGVALVTQKNATYNHFKVYDVCSFHSG